MKKNKEKLLSGLLSTTLIITSGNMPIYASVVGAIQKANQVSKAGQVEQQTNEFEDTSKKGQEASVSEESEQSVMNEAEQVQEELEQPDPMEASEEEEKETTVQCEALANDQMVSHLTKKAVQEKVAQLYQAYNASSTGGNELFMVFEEDTSAAPAERIVQVGSFYEPGYEDLLTGKFALVDQEGNEITDVKWYAAVQEEGKGIALSPDETKAQAQCHIVLKEDGSFEAKPIAETEDSQGIGTRVFAEYNGSLYYFMASLKTVKDTKAEITEQVMDEIITSHSEWQSMTASEAALAVYQFIAGHVRYPDKERGLELFNKCLYADSYKYYALVRGVAVCNGYAKTYNGLLGKLGIETEFVNGHAILGNGELSAHAWSLIKLQDGKWYLADATWDDMGDYAVTKNFLVSKEVFDKTHEKSNAYVGKEFGTEYLYDKTQQEEQTQPTISFNQHTKVTADDGSIQCEVKVKDVTNEGVKTEFVVTQDGTYDSYAFYIYEGIGTNGKRIALLPQKENAYTFKKDGFYTIVCRTVKNDLSLTHIMNIKLGEQPSQGTENNPGVGDNEGTVEKPGTGDSQGTAEKPESGDHQGTVEKPGTEGSIQPDGQTGTEDNQGSQQLEGSTDEGNKLPADPENIVAVAISIDSSSAYTHTYMVGDVISTEGLMLLVKTKDQQTLKVPVTKEMLSGYDLMQTGV